MKIVIDKMIEKEMKTGLWMLDRARKYVYLYIRKRKTPFKLRLTEEVDKKINAQDWRFFDELVAKNFTASGNVKREEVDPLLGVKIRKTEERGKAIKKNIAKKSETDINQIMDQLKEKFSYEEKFKHSYYKKTPSLWIKYGKVRLYIPRDAYEQAGYIDLKTGEAFPSRPGNDRILKEALNNKLVKKLINYYRGDLKNKINKNSIETKENIEIDGNRIKHIYYKDNWVHLIFFKNPDSTLIDKFTQSGLIVEKDITRWEYHLGTGKLRKKKLIIFKRKYGLDLEKYINQKKR